MPVSELNVPPSARGGIVTIGNFDGVHLGHQAMLKEVRRIAQDQNGPAVVVTFDPHPIAVLKPQIAQHRLTTLNTRIRLLKQFGADQVVILPVNTDLLSMSACAFFERLIVDKLDAAGVVEGPDFRFGAGRSGDIPALRQLCEQHSIALSVIESVKTESEVISSTSIRQMLQNGDFSDAIDRLGHPLTICGKVAHGAGRGRQLGFPTANLIKIDTLLPAHGVYSGVCTIDGRRYSVAVNVGPNPTFQDQSEKVECHICNYSGSLYGAELSVDLLSRIRELKTFDSVAELTEQIREDLKHCTQEDRQN